jgi:hypothetical protein
MLTALVAKRLVKSLVRERRHFGNYSLKSLLLNWPRSHCESAAEAVLAALLHRKEDILSAAKKSLAGAKY